MDNFQNNNQNKGGLGALLKLNRTTRVGSWTVAVTLILLAVLVVINLLVGALPSAWTRLDTTSAGLYTISSTTEKYVSSIDRDVKLTVVTQNTVSATLQTFLDRYSSMSRHIKVGVVDPVKDPTFLDNYSEITGSGNYIVVESDLRYTVVDVDSLEYVYINDADATLDTATYNELLASPQYVNYYAQNGIDLYNITAYFDGERAVTSAIEYVVTETIPHIYLLSGNGEAELSAIAREMFETALMEYETLTLEAGEAIPESASCVIINAPRYDLTDGTTAALSEYIAAGGNVLLMTSPDSTELPNLMGLMAAMGVKPTTGGALNEGNANAYVSSPQNLKPKVNAQHTVTYTVANSGYTMVMPAAHGILADETLPAGITLTQLFNASDAYVGDTDYGAVATGVALENTENGSKVVWFASSDAFSDAAASAYGMGATYYLAIAANWLNDGYASTLTEIAAVDVSTQPLTVSFGAALIWGGILTLVVPAVLVVSGIVVWARRRKH